MTEVVTIVALIYVIFLIVMIGLAIWGFVLYVKLANRGIKALDIYINEKSNKEPNDYYVSDNNNSGN